MAGLAADPAEGVPGEFRVSPALSMVQENHQTPLDVVRLGVKWPTDLHVLSTPFSQRLEDRA